MTSRSVVAAKESASLNLRAVIAVICAAGFGGLLPTIAKMAAVYVADPGADWPKAGMYLGLALFFILGAGVALVMRESDFRKAVALGIAAPGIITNLAAGSDQARVAETAPAAEPPAELAADWGRVFGVASANAAEAPIRLAQAPPAAAPSTAQLNVLPTVQGVDGKFAVPPVTFQFVTKDGVLLSEAAVNPRVQSTLSVPQGAYAVRASSGGKTENTRLPRSASYVADLHLAVEFDRGSDFLWALGGSRRVKVDDVDVSIRNVREPAVSTATQAAVVDRVVRGTEVLNSKGERVGVVQSVDRAPGKPTAIVIQSAP